MRRAALLVAVLLFASCGRVQTGIDPDASAPRTASPPTPTASDSTAGWQAFASPQLGYSIKLPSTLRYQGSTGGSDRSDYFSNEDAAAPEQMDQSGIFVTIVVTTDTGDQCVQHGLGGVTIDRVDSVIVDGSGANLEVFSAQGAAMMVLNVLHGGHCYQFDFITWNPQIRDANEVTAQRMLGTFHYGLGPGPT